MTSYSKGFELMPVPTTPAVLRERGECRFDPALHTGPGALTIEPADHRAAREEVAREVCASCPLLVSCREFALSAGPKSGVWAGLSAREIRTRREAARVLGEVA